MVAETIKHFTSIDTIIEQSQLLEKENRLDPWLARILITEMLWRGKQLPLQAKPLQTVNSYYDILKQHKEAIESSTQATDVMKKGNAFILSFSDSLCTLSFISCDVHNGRRYCYI